MKKQYKVAIGLGDTINDYGEVSLETLRSSNIDNKNNNSFYYLFMNGVS
jgi:hypothetical protein